MSRLGIRICKPDLVLSENQTTDYILNHWSAKRPIQARDWLSAEARPFIVGPIIIRLFGQAEIEGKQSVVLDQALEFLCQSGPGLIVDYREIIFAYDNPDGAAELPMIHSHIDLRCNPHFLEGTRWHH